MNILRKRIGVLGGGQLGRMLIEESLRLNLNFNILDPDAGCPCNLLADTFICGSLTDASKINELALVSDVLTFEIEHVNTAALLALEEQGKTIIPSPRILQMIQDKGLQKQFYEQHQIPGSRFVLVNDKSEWAAAVKKLESEKFVAKTRKDGYDGKGVAILNSAGIINGSANIPFDEPCVLEEFIPCEKELAIIIARDAKGNILAYPAVEMEFDAVANLVTFLVSPARIDNYLAAKAEMIARKVVESFDGIGIFAVEMFLSKAGDIFVNEVAPRPHNSGHHTIEACYTSQYEQLVRILLELPLGSTEMLQPAGMINLLGPAGFSGAYQFDNLEMISNMPGIFIHLYAKNESRPMRKMGHVSIMAPTLEEVVEKAAFVKKHLVIIPM
ncbi:MAG: 5-(carboxyamino)imidazole ribonucleotide synthase [Bacteroidia bacterium]|nr:5-(carboxyamino)imidazole ribonucleotide synthase [Bacteroidia bacterium]